MFLMGIPRNEYVRKQIRLLVEVVGKENIKETKSCIDYEIGFYLLDILTVDELVNFVLCEFDKQDREEVSNIFCIKCIRQITNAGLKDSKHWYDSHKDEIKKKLFEKELYHQ